VEAVTVVAAFLLIESTHSAKYIVK